MASHQLRVLVTFDVITVGVKCNAECNNASQNISCVLIYIVLMISFIYAFSYMKVWTFFTISTSLTQMKEWRHIPTFGLEQ